MLTFPREAGGAVCQRCGRLNGAREPFVVVPLGRVRDLVVCWSCSASVKRELDADLTQLASPEVRS